MICQATTVVGKMSRMGHRINVIGCWGILMGQWGIVMSQRNTVMTVEHCDGTINPGTTLIELWVIVMEKFGTAMVQ